MAVDFKANKWMTSIRIERSIDNYENCDCDSDMILAPANEAGKFSK